MALKLKQNLLNTGSCGIDIASDRRDFAIYVFFG